MNQEVKAQWVKALRSGSYRQGHYALRNRHSGDSFCCLGVLCDLYEKATSETESFWKKDALGFNYSFEAEGCESDTELPEPVIKWAGLYDARSDCDAEADLIAYNDTGMSFDDIANLIEEQL